MKMRSLLHPKDLRSIEARFHSLAADDKPRWGSMSVAGAVCHCTDAFLYPLGEKAAERVTRLPPIPLPVFKWMALRAPVRWPKGVPSTPEMTQGIGGTAPGEFAEDRALLVRTLLRFAARRDGFPDHPIFGRLSAAEWMRWGYLHSDHHLRQFGR